MPLYVECLSHSASMKADVMWSVKQQQGSEGELESNQRDKTNACNLKMISLALTKNSLNTDQSSIDRITVQQSLCIRIIFSRVERKSLKFFFWLTLGACMCHRGLMPILYSGNEI